MWWNSSCSYQQAVKSASLLYIWVERVFVQYLSVTSINKQLGLDCCNLFVTVRKRFHPNCLACSRMSRKTNAITRLFLSRLSPSTTFSLCFALLLPSSAFLFGVLGVNGCLFQMFSRWLCNLWRKTTFLLWLHKQVIRFPGVEINLIILGTYYACSTAILVI